MSTTIANHEVEEKPHIIGLSPPASSIDQLTRYNQMVNGTQQNLDDSQPTAVTPTHDQNVMTGKTTTRHQEETVFDKERSKVLLVEDNLDLAEIIIETLRLIDIEIDHATHGSKAVEKFKSLNPALVLLDLQLPDISGWRILDHINELQAGLSPQERTKIIVITSHDDPPNRLISKLQGVSFFLAKPITMDQLENVVHKALNGDDN